MRSSAPKRAAPSQPWPLLRHLAAALDADVHLTAGHDLGSVWFDPTQLAPTSTAVRGHGAYRHTLPGAVGVTRSISAQSVCWRSSFGMVVGPHRMVIL